MKKSRTALVVASLALTMGALNAASAGAAGNAGGAEEPTLSPISVPVDPHAKEALDYWTPERTRATVAATNGVSADGQTLRTQAVLDNRVGALFFTLDGKDAFCTATSVVSGKRSGVIETAAHCIRSAGNTATNQVFIPGYNNGSRPFGTFGMNGRVLAGNYDPNNPNTPVGDIAFATTTLNENDRSLLSQVGGYGLAFVDPSDVSGPVNVVYYVGSYDQESCGGVTSPYSSSAPGTWTLLCGVDPLGGSGSAIKTPFDGSDQVIGITHGKNIINNEVFLGGQINEVYAENAYEDLIN
ncbi:MULTISPECIES: trypsin-like serine peptidase [unclassified Streptomyces]|uniref:trypsin-like serine peptidase n=1 Tax=unclassified Streptomyces TaxID=2593676 RepID=UPI0036E8AEC4